MFMVYKSYSTRMAVSVSESTSFSTTVILVCLHIFSHRLLLYVSAMQSCFLTDQPVSDDQQILGFSLPGIVGICLLYLNT